MKPFTDNVIFWDSEFSDLDPYKGELLSVGMVKPSGEELYLEFEVKGEVSDWVKANVLPHLTQQKVSRDEAVKRIFEFLGTNRPYMVAYVNQFDTVYFYKMLSDLLKNSANTKNFPFHWIHIDYASMLFAMGIDPERFNFTKPGNFVADLGIDTSKFNKHHALDDARLLKEIYLKMLTHDV